MNFKEYISDKKFLRVASELAAETGDKIYIVGGFVRDIILDRKRADIDILVIGSGPDFAAALAKKLRIKKVSVFRNFGTAHFKYRNIDLEFVGARKESYERNSRKPVVEDGTFEDDINRRDFTINTLALSLNKDSFGEMIDTFGGYEHIQEGFIQTPLDPMVTFDDDPLRILRAFRFASQLNFTVSDEIKVAAGKMASRLKIVSQERITDEFLKIMASPNPSTGLKLLYQCGVMEVIFPEVAKLAGTEQREQFHHKDVFYHTVQVIDNVAEVSDNVWLRFAALVHDIAKPKTKKFVDDIGWTFHGHEEIGARMMKGLFKRLKLPQTKLAYVENLVRLHLRPIALVDDEVTDSAIRRLIVTAGEDLDDLIKLCRADITSKNPNKVTRFLSNYDIVVEKIKEVEEKDELRAFQSPVSGDVIMKTCGLKPSRIVGEIKGAIEDAILEGDIENNYEAAFQFLLKIKDKYLNN